MRWCGRVPCPLNDKESTVDYIDGEVVESTSADLVPVAEESWRIGDVDFRHVRGADLDDRQRALTRHVREHGPFHIRKRRDLVVLAGLLGMRGDWHEPDEQEVTAMSFGQSFDNAGFWPLTTGHETICEMYTALVVRACTVAYVNQATLFAWATGYDK
jgi:hypothetical protein